MRALTSKSGDLLSHFDNINEGNTLADFNSTPSKQMFNDNPTEAANKGKIEGHLPLKQLFGIRKTFKKLLKTQDFF